MNERQPIMLSTGQPSTLGVWRNLAAATFGEDSPATRYLDAKLAEEGAEMEVLADEQQLLHALVTIHNRRGQFRGN
jgi:hypothetical protein